MFHWVEVKDGLLCIETGAELNFCGDAIYYRRGNFGEGFRFIRDCSEEAWLAFCERLRNK